MNEAERFRALRETTRQGKRPEIAANAGEMQLVTLTPQGVIAEATSRRMRACVDCDRYDPTPNARPCELAKWTHCELKRAAIAGTSPSPDCPWNQLEALS